MPISEDQARSLLQKAKERKPGITREEASMLLKEANARFDASQPQKEEKPTFQKVADFIGLGTVAKNIDTIASAPVIKKHTKEFEKYSSVANKQVSDLVSKAKSEKDPVKKQALLDQSRVISRDIEEKTNLFNQNISKLQGISGVSEREMEMSPEELAVRRGAGQSAELASFVLPSVVPGGSTVATRILSGAGRGAVAGSLQGAARATEADTVGEGAADIATGAVTGAAAGALIQGTVESGSALANFLKGKTAKVRDQFVNMYKSTLKRNVADQRFYQQYGGEDKVIKDAIKYKLPNTKDGVINELNSFKSEYERTITKATSQMEKDGVKMSISDAYKKAQDKVKEKLGYDDALLKQANRWFEDNAKKYANQSSALPKSVNNLRKSLDQRVGDVLTSDTYGQDAARKAFASELRMMFKDKAPFEARNAIQKYHLLSGLSDAMQVEPKFGLVEAALAGASPGSGAANILELLAAKAVRSPGLRREIASRGFRVAPTKINASQINSSPIINPAVAALQRVIDKESQSKQTRHTLP